MFYPRALHIDQFKTSSFLFGPRMTGKTTLLHSIISVEYIDLMDPDLELSYKSDPKLFWQQLSALPKGSLIIVDEVQKVPVLLNYVQKAMDTMDQRFILSGSSARKLKRGGANLLGGRALDLKLYPLTTDELKNDFHMDRALHYGTLPKICDLLHARQTDLVKQHLKSYITTYIREEIQAEALTRNLGAFNRFLNIAAQANGQVIEFANISRECSVPMSTVKEYFQILEDTLIGFFLWPWDRSERKKARPKFYFFDCGVARAIQNRLNDPPTMVETGILFETWLVNELHRMRDYSQKEHTFSFWRQREEEVDILISNSRGPVFAIECKTGRGDLRRPTITQFRKTFPKVPLVVASLRDNKPRKIGTQDVWPWQQVLTYYKDNL
ncbi:MAG: ATP-binding protein [Candidatus Firestonebacteria bacterium]|nr:ATP-binding protein [Candidatus Firestonebacteria bacterium]